MTMSEPEPTEHKVAYVQKSVDGNFGVHIYMKDERGRFTFHPIDAPSFAQAAAELRIRWPDVQIVSKEEYDRVFWGPAGRPSRRTLAQAGEGRGSAGRPAQAPHGSDTGRIVYGQDRARGVRVQTTSTGSEKVAKAPLEVPSHFTDDYELSPVQAAKYLGVPPQYVYNKIRTGRLKAVQGPTSKLVKWKEVRNAFGK